MKTLLFFLSLLITTISFPQTASDGWTFPITIDTTGAGLTGEVLQLPDGCIPISCYVDTLTDAATVGFEVLIGNDVQSNSQNWRNLTTVSTGGTNYVATLTDDKFVPLLFDVMKGLANRSGSYANQKVFIRPVLSAKQDKPIILYLKVIAYRGM
jgi:hypothetical protein